MASIDCMTVGLALTDSDQHLLRYAALLADRGIGTRFQFVHVMVPAHAGHVGLDQHAAQRQMQAAVAAAFGTPAEDLPARFDVSVGVRVDQLLAYSQHYPADVVLLGHRRNRSGKRSLAQRMAMLCPSSVWSVPDGVPCEIRSILAPVDFSSHSADSLSVATEIAEKLSLSECHALHVSFDPSIIRYDEHLDHLRSEELGAFRKFVDPVNTHGVSVSPIFEEASNVTQAILRTAAERGSDLIVMSTRGRSSAAAILLGSETSQTLMESPVPVLAVKHQGAALNLLQALIDPDLWRQSSLHTN